ncbi:tetratricopeptide repeat protein [Maribacter sp. 1_MG-2023]|uniref:transcriptional regulator n=1 Tax=Maribacter sp. 1_MG-2023 TaxID=3062677 RepID=UPI0026E355E5|nr:tetratricopeptide repeat protein [Maribacter sp. 1_MG-2023]MDO6470427.1 tetratricopeptide repeat protein [Maribacter sp. 1_MG-2023]
MNYTIQTFRGYMVIFSTLVLLICLSGILSAQNINKTDQYFQKAESLKATNIDSAISFYKKSIHLHKEQKDTANLVNSLYELSNLYAHNLDYGNSYDGYWEALFLADSSKNDVARTKLYQALGWLYLFYRRDNEANNYFNLSLRLKDKMIDEKVMNSSYLLTDYYALTTMFRTNGNDKMVRKYLDSSNIIRNQYKIKSNYLDAEEGYQDARDGDFEMGLLKLNKSRNEFEIENPSYLIIIDYLIGQVYFMKGDLEESRKFFEQSLAYTTVYSNHSNYKLMVQEALALLDKQVKDFESAFFHLETANELNELIFGRKSKNNQHLFEINDKYRLQKEKEKELIKEQRLANLENEEKLWVLKFLLMFVVVASLLILGFLFIRNIRRKHKLEKKSLEEKRVVELQKTNEILELKNNELTSSALQLIEKEEFIRKMKDTIGKSKENLDVSALNRIISSAQGSPSGNWKEFEARFTAVNQSFYKNLKDAYPSLSQTDLKLCALVKLNFSSKEMASLLGISIESMHTSRYRLRKKLKLKRNDNLTEFIANH